jgi:hypothetical protein
MSDGSSSPLPSLKDLDALGDWVTEVAGAVHAFHHLRRTAMEKNLNFSKNPITQG